jgi:hypothetical protein
MAVEDLDGSLADGFRGCASGAGASRQPPRAGGSLSEEVKPSVREEYAAEGEGASWELASGMIRSITRRLIGTRLRASANHGSAAGRETRR